MPTPLTTSKPFLPSPRSSPDAEKKKLGVDKVKLMEQRYCPIYPERVVNPNSKFEVYKGKKVYFWSSAHPPLETRSRQILFRSREARTSQGIRRQSSLNFIKRLRTGGAFFLALIRLTGPNCRKAQAKIIFAETQRGSRFHRIPSPNRKRPRCFGLSCVQCVIRHPEGSISTHCFLPLRMRSKEAGSRTPRFVQLDRKGVSEVTRRIHSSFPSNVMPMVGSNAQDIIRLERK